MTAAHNLFFKNTLLLLAGTCMRRLLIFYLGHSRTGLKMFTVELTTAIHTILTYKSKFATSRPEFQHRILNHSNQVTSL